MLHVKIGYEAMLDVGLTYSMSGETVSKIANQHLTILVEVTTGPLWVLMTDPLSPPAHYD